MRSLAANWTAGALSGLVCAATFAIAPARAADDNKTIDQAVLDFVLRGVGLERETPQIDYHERAPLVIPPTKTLPPPEKSDAVTANPAWPKDPDVIRRREAARQERERNISDEREREQNPLRPDQIEVGPKPRSVARRDDGYRAPANGFSNPLMPNELGFTKGPLGLLNKMFSGNDDDKPVRFTGEPRRTDLTSPPPGYQTPSPDQPYGPGKAPPPKAENNYLTRGEVDSGSGSGR